MTETAPAHPDEPIYLAAVDLIGRTGAEAFQLRYSDEEQPVVWMAVATYSGERWETAGGKTPTEAMTRLCDQLVDGGTCSHCGRPAGCLWDLAPGLIPEHVCWYQFDPELRTMRRGCE